MAAAAEGMRSGAERGERERGMGRGEGGSEKAHGVILNGERMAR